ncbi:MAG: electron transport complex subunit E [Gammaproteobacteria bacterium]|nr:electron transport complex subunit E [Gammaproteobacteria bacterium]
MPLSKSESSSITPQTRDIVSQGLWSNNAALVQLLGLCPLLAVSNSVVNAAGLGLATIGVLLGSNGIVSLSRHRLTPAIRLPIFVLIIATFTTCAELLLRAFAIELYQALGIFIPLIVTNCTILGRAESFASKNALGPSLLDGLMTGLGFAAVLLVLGMLRELAGTGAVFANMDRLLPFAGNWTLQVASGYKPFLLAILPPGAFLFMGGLIALKNILDKKRANPSPVKQQPTPGKRVRVTG